MNGICMKNDNLLVSELTDDLIVNGVATIYDSDSPYMFCKVLVTCDSETYPVGSILVIKRYAKEEFLPGQYFISTKDVRCVYLEETYNKLLGTDDEK